MVQRQLESYEKGNYESFLVNLTHLLVVSECYLCFRVHKQNYKVSDGKSEILLEACLVGAKRINEIFTVSNIHTLSICLMKPKYNFSGF